MTGLVVVVNVVKVAGLVVVAIAVELRQCVDALVVRHAFLNVPSRLALQALEEDLCLLLLTPIIVVG